MAELEPDAGVLAGPRGLWQLVRPHTTLLLAAFAGMVLESAAGLWEPWPLKLIFDHVLGNKPLPGWAASWAVFGTAPLALLNAAVAALIAIAVLGALGSYTQKYLSTAAGQRIAYDLRRRLYRHIQRLSLPFFESRRTGDLVVRLTSDVDAAQDFISSALLGLAINVLTLVGMLALMLYLDWQFTLLSLAVAPALFAVIYRRTRHVKSVAREAKRKESALASIVQEAVSSVRTVRAFAREDYEQARLDRESLDAMRVALRARSLKASLPPIVDILVAVGTGVVLLVGVRLVLAGRFTPGTLLVFVVYLGKLYKPMKDLSRMTDTMTKAAVGLERIREVLATEPFVADRPDAVEAPRFEGRIALRNVRFGYTPGTTVLDGISLTVEPGMHVALAGVTGSGKSTILSLLLRLYDPNTGAIAIDGRDIREYSLASLREQIAYVPQDPVLFHAPVWQNIAYGRPGASRDAIIDAARLAHAHEFIARLPDGYDTVVGERGDTLSGGQRQRLAIARALVKQAPILLLDEPSAALDAESEALVLDALQRLARGRTSITIAHRLATLQRAERIVLLDGGVVAAAGTHDELLRRSPRYARHSELQQHSSRAPGAAVAVAWS